MKKLLLGLLATSGLCLAAPAMAADLYVPPEPAPAYFDWTGVYVGGQVGYLWADATIDGDLLAGDTDSRPDFDGVFGGLYVGYNYQISSIVLGIDADIAFTGADGTDGVTLNGVPQPGNSESAEMDIFGAVRGRLGFAIDRVMPYVAGGLAIGDATFKIDHVGDDGKFSKTLLGWTIGGGVDWAATDNLIVRVEYRYTDYGKTSDNPLALFPAEEYTGHLKTQDIRLGISWLF